MIDPSAVPQFDGPRVVGGHRLLERVEVREVGTLHLAQREGAPVLLWWVDTASLPEVAVTWLDVVRGLAAVKGPSVLAPREWGADGSLRWMSFAAFASEPLTLVFRTLAQARTPMPWELACFVVAEAAEGLEALHECHDGARSPWPLHGAVSGLTFSVTFDGRVLLFDPGRLFPVQEASFEALSYSAPERVWSEPADRRADVFALGALAWELCSGRRLFRGRDDDETRALLEAHVVPAIAPKLRAPHSLDAVLGRALARGAQDRFATAGELAQALRALAGAVARGDLAKFMGERFGGREREHRARVLAASEATEIRIGMTQAVALDARNDEATRNHASSIPASATNVTNVTREDVTLPRAEGPMRPRLDSATQTLVTDEETLTRANQPADDDFEQKTLPRISGSQLLAAVPVQPVDESEEVLLLEATPPSDEELTRGTVDEPTRKRDLDDTSETPLQATRARVLERREELTTTPTRVRPEPRRAGSAPALEAPPRPVRPASVPAMRVRPAPELAVARPGPVPAPPRPVPRTPPPPPPPPPPAPPAQLAQAPAQAFPPAPPFVPATSTSESVAFGPVIPQASTVLDEPREKVIVESRGGFPPVAPAAAIASQPSAPPAPVIAYAPEPAMAVASLPASAPPPAIMLPRDPQMQAMQRALVARDATREPDRRIAVPVVAVALFVAVAVAIGIPLLARRPARVVAAPVVPASTTGPSASAPITSGTTAGPVASAPAPSSPAPPAPVTTGVVGLVPAPPPLNPLALPDSRAGVRTAQPPPRVATPPQPAPAPRPRRDPPVRRPEPEPPTIPRELPVERDPPPPARDRDPPRGGTGLLTVICNPACDEVLDGSRSLGPSPVFKVSVSAGSHRLTLRISDPPVEKVVSVTVAPDETTVLTQPMPK
ncbi:MAG: hypothetical protein IPG50_02785 [Myxococcales bacterium]|nr:hypothetical protein [Myxococcales bacterium]